MWESEYDAFGVCESVQIMCIGESEYTGQHLSVNIIFVGVCERVNTMPIGVSDSVRECASNFYRRE